MRIVEIGLVEMFGVELAWTEATPRRVEAESRAVAAGAYDLVLSATGFHNHSVDAILSRAARTGGARYVRVDRGGPLACLRALVRELGPASATSL